MTQKEKQYIERQSANAVAYLNECVKLLQSGQMRMMAIGGFQVERGYNTRRVGFTMVLNNERKAI